MRVKGFATVAMLTLIIGILVGGIVVFAYFQLNPTSVPSSTSSSQAISSPVASPVTDETTSWQTYKGLDFEIKYPQDVTVKTDGEGYAWFNKWGPSQLPETEFYDALNLRIKTEDLNDSTLEDVADGEFNNVNTDVAEIIQPLAKTDFNGKEAYTFTTRGLGTFKYTIAVESSKIIKIMDFTEDPTNQGFKKTIDQMISTFKLTT